MTVFTPTDRGANKYDIELDMQDPRVLDKMMPYLTVYHGNPHSRTHMYGWETEAAVEYARKVSISIGFVYIIRLCK